MWFGITGLLANLGGWAHIARSYPVGAAPSGRRFSFVSGSMGMRFLPVHYGNCLFLDVGVSGFRLSILLPFRFLAPPMFIPWPDVTSVTTKKFLFVSYVVITIRDQWPTISIRGRAGRCIQETYSLGGARNALTIGSSDRGAAVSMDQGVGR
jgi:hypothetical protein